jgi:hypothetical protein
MIERLPPTQTKILLGLAKYKFLTTSQMIQLGVATKRSNLTPHLQKLRNGTRPFIGRMEFGTHPKEGRLEDFYYLKTKAKNALMEELQMDEKDIHIPLGTSTLFSNDYFHRKYTLDCHIAIEQVAGKRNCEVLLFERYFDKIGSNRKGGTLRAKTRIDIGKENHLIADGVFILKTPKQEELYCLEMYNGKDTKRVHKQLRQYVQALALGSPSIKYDHKTEDGSRYRGCRVLSIFEYESCMKAVIERLEKDQAFANMKELFLFQELQGIKQDLRAYGLE